MKKVLMFLMVFSFAFIFLFLPKVEVEASEVDLFAEETDAEVSVFDMLDDGAQEIEFINERGEKVVMGVEAAEESVPLITTFGTYPISVGTYDRKIYYYSGAINISYKITTQRIGSSTKIIDAWGLSVNLVGYTESNRSFGFTSKRAEYTGSAVLFNFLLSLGTGLSAEISGTNLITKGWG